MAPSSGSAGSYEDDILTQVPPECAEDTNAVFYDSPGATAKPRLRGGGVQPTPRRVSKLKSRSLTINRHSNGFPTSTSTADNHDLDLVVEVISSNESVDSPAGSLSSSEPVPAPQPTVPPEQSPSTSPHHLPLTLLSSPVEDLQPSFPDVNAQFASDDDGDFILPTTIDSDDENSIRMSIEPDHNSFWQYRKAEKGPKPKLKFNINVSQPEKNPHEPIAFTDPVFDKSQNHTMMRHFGKARIGEGNDITPNPAKLSQLGSDIEAVAERMSEIGDDVKKRAEKVRLSSRLCRMKRSANNEANKIKLDGLEKEREEISSVITEVQKKIDSSQAPGEKLSPHLKSLMKGRLKIRVAGKTSEYVNSVLEKFDESDTFTDSEDSDY